MTTALTNPKFALPPAESTETETWRPVDGWPYEVSDMGRVRRVGFRRGATVGRVIVPAPSCTGYLKMVLYDAPRKKSEAVHRLVMLAFGPPQPSPVHEVNHINATKTDNRMVNLEWVTRSENMRHAVLAGVVPIGNAHPKAVLTADVVRRARLMYIDGARTTHIAEALGHPGKRISQAILRAWTHVVPGPCAPRQSWRNVGGRGAR